VVIYETQQRFPMAVAQKVVEGFIEGARSVGKLSPSDFLPWCTNSIIYIGMTITDTKPLISWENGQGVISDVGISSTRFMYGD